MSKGELQKLINQSRRAMEKAVKELDFSEATRFRDEMFAYQKIIIDAKD
jgi:excinuclease ABC subunit B